MQGLYFTWDRLWCLCCYGSGFLDDEWWWKLRHYQLKKPEDGTERLAISEEDSETNEAANPCPANVIHLVDLRTNKKSI